jgi:hypothetical protein
MFFPKSNSIPKQFNTLDWKTDVTVNTYLVQKMHQQYDERKNNFEKALQSKEALLVYIESISKNF